jgi:hypothetical protein
MAYERRDKLSSLRFSLLITFSLAMKICLCVFGFTFMTDESVLFTDYYMRNKGRKMEGTKFLQLFNEFFIAAGTKYSVSNVYCQTV